MRAISTACSALAVWMALAFPPAAAHFTPAGSGQGPDDAYADVVDWLNGALEVRHTLTIYVRPKVQDSAFRADLIAPMRDHPEWNAVFGR